MKENKDKLEEFVKGHRAEFDDLEPSPMSWARIEQNIAPKPTRNWRNIMWRAASVLIIFVASFLANEYWHQYRSQQIAQPAADERVKEIVIPELLEAEAYYTSKVEERLKEFERFGKNDPEAQNDLNFEMKELDKAFSDLKEDLKDDMANEEIVEAMIQNYRIKLKLLEEIISQLKEQEVNIEKDEVIEYEI